MKHVIWSNDYLTVESIMDEFRNENPDLTINDAWNMACEENDSYLDCEKTNLDIDVGEILVIADLGLWDGRKKAHKIIGGNIGDVTSVCCGDGFEWYVEDGELRIDDHHHDGTNRYLFRKWKPGVTDLEKGVALSLIKNGFTDAKTLNVTTLPLGEDVCRVYGWKEGD